MKIVILTKYWKGSHGGGIKNYLINLVNEFNKKDDLETFVLFREGSDSEQYNIKGNKILYILKSFFVMKKIRPQVVHSQGTWYTLMAGYAYKIMYNTNLIHTYRSEPSHKSHKLALITNKINKIMLDKCDFVTFVSKGLMNSLEETYELNFNNFFITYPGVKGRQISKKEIDAFKDKFNLGSNSIVLLIQAFTANDLKAEGVKCVFHALKSLIIKYPNILLIVTREGHYSIELKNYAKYLGISDSIVFTGDIENPFVPLEICDVFLFPWLGKSGVSNALLEAMYMGKPIIATCSTSTHGVSEVIENNQTGFLVPPKVDSIVDIIDYVIQNPMIAQKVGQNARRLALNKFTWKSTADLFELIYNKKL